MNEDEKANEALEFNKLLVNIREEMKKQYQYFLSLYTPSGFMIADEPTRPKVWISNGLKVESWDNELILKKYDQVELISAFLYFINLDNIDKVETQSLAEMIFITLHYKDGNSLNAIVKRLKKGVKLFEDFTGHKVRLERTNGDIKSTIKAKVSRKKDYTVNVMVEYAIFIDDIEPQIELKKLGERSRSFSVHSLIEGCARRYGRNI